MKQGNEWLKVMSIALSCVMLVTTALMNVLADEVTTKVNVAVEATEAEADELIYQKLIENISKDRALFCTWKNKQTLEEIA